MTLSATYSPDDNKLRLYADGKLDESTYQRVKAAGFRWAPMQKLFVAPSWSPDREDLLIDLCGEIEDEDRSLVERAEERAERFEELSEKRLDDAHRARADVDEIANGIPLGQPILVGHHSEKHARKHAQKIESGMRRAVKMWETSKYWEDRARGAVSSAKYKERPDVRHRRIKGLEADLRKIKGYYTPADNPPHYIMQTGWNDTEPSQHVWCGPKGRGGQWVKVSRLPAIEAAYARWVQHYENRLAYERGMLAEVGGIAADKFANIEIGGMVLVGGEWVTITKINKKAGEIVSVSTNARYCRVKGIEEIRDYRSPTEEQAAKTKAATNHGPLCNYPGEAFKVKDYDAEPRSFAHITQAEWDAKHKDYKGSHVIFATETTGKHRVRIMLVRHQYVPVFITDAKVKLPPTPDAKTDVKRSELPKEPHLPSVKAAAARQEKFRAKVADDETSPFELMKDSLKAGVAVVSAPQLFPTPPEIAKQVVQLASIEPGHRVLEPSAGTGNIAAIVREVIATHMANAELAPSLKCVEINHGLADRLVRFGYDVTRADFLETNGELGLFDRVIMNPPFANGADIKHILHAKDKLKPGGRLVAICANGPRQQEKLQPLATAWIDLPDGSFANEGTNVRTAICVIDAD